MKIMKKKISSIRDQYTVILESLHSNFKVFGESLGAVRDGLEEFREDVKKEFAGVHSNFQTVFDYLSRIDDELKDIKSEMKKIKEELKSKADFVRFEALEARVLKIEEELAHRR